MFEKAARRWFGREQRRFPKPGWMLGGIALGTGVMYLLDPRMGRRRRARAEQALAHEARELKQGVVVGARDTAAKTRGFFARLRLRSAARAGTVSDDVLAERARARLGRSSAHPGSIEVQCRDGVIALSGPILRADIDRVLSEVEHVPGVRSVENKLEIHAEPGNVPGLQGHPHAAHQGALRPGWPPARRLGAATAGLGLAAYGVLRGGPAGWLTSAAGALLASRGILNIPLKRLTGIGARRRAIDIHKTVDVDAPVEDVFAFWSNLESFPRFMTHVKKIQRTGENRWHWEVSGPADTTVSWDVEVSKVIPDHLIVWRSLPGSIVRNGGVVRFRRRGRGTRIDVHLVYNPPAGAIGHAIAALLGATPKKQMDDDLMRFKTLIERGKATGRQGTTARDEIGRGPALPQPQPPERGT